MEAEGSRYKCLIGSQGAFSLLLFLSLTAEEDREVEGDAVVKSVRQRK